MVEVVQGNLPLGIQAIGDFAAFFTKIWLVGFYMNRRGA